MYFFFNMVYNMLAYINQTYLTFGWSFNQKVDFSFGIKYLKLSNDKVHNLDYLHVGIEVLE